MKKYLFVFKATLIESLQYILNILSGFITFFIVLLVFMNLWDYIYSDAANLISGYTKTQMIWYVIITEIMWFGTSNRTLTYQISNDIKSGTIAYGLNKPYHYIAYIVSKHLGEIAFKFILFLGSGLLIGYLFLHELPSVRLYQLPLIAISFFLGIMINTLLRISISVLSFWIEDAIPFHWIYDKLILIIGTMFPIEMFPAWAQPIITGSPIYVVNYGPAKLTIDFSNEIFIRILPIQILYFMISSSILLFLYQKGVKKLNVNGG